MKEDLISSPPRTFCDILFVGRHEAIYPVRAPPQRPSSGPRSGILCRCCCIAHPRACLCRPVATAPRASRRPLAQRSSPLSCSTSPARARGCRAASSASRTPRAAPARSTPQTTDRTFNRTWIDICVAALLPWLPPAGQPARHGRPALLRHACRRLAPRWCRRRRLSRDSRARLCGIREGRRPAGRRRARGNGMRVAGDAPSDCDRTARTAPDPPRLTSVGVRRL